MELIPSNKIMYPEDVYNCGLPLPFEFLRPIAFQVAYEHIKEKLKFPTCTCETRFSYVLFIKNNPNELQNVYMYWASFNERYFEVYHVEHRPHISGEPGRISMDRGFERKYQYFPRSGKSQFYINGTPDELLKFTSHS